MKCNLVRLAICYKNKKGEEKRTFDYYLQFDNGERIAILPKWSVVGDKKSDSDFIRMRAMSDLVERDNKDEE